MKDSLEDCTPYSLDALLEDPPPEVRQLVRKYVALSTKHHPNESESDQLEAILKMAETDDRLALWIVALDAVISRKLGLLELDHYREYEDQHDKLILCLSEHTKDDRYEGHRELLVSCASVPNSSNEVNISRPADIEKSFKIDSNLYQEETD